MPDEVENVDPITVPLRLLKPIKLNKASGSTGLLWPLRKNLPPTLLIDWDGCQYALYLGGPHSMGFFPIKPDLSMRGALIDNAEFVVDVTSRYDAVQQQDPRGAIVLRDGKSFIVGIALGESFADPVPVPLWGDYEAGTRDEAIGFTRWSLITRHGDTTITLWKQDSTEAE